MVWEMIEEFGNINNADKDAEKRMNGAFIEHGKFQTNLIHLKKKNFGRNA